MLLYSWFETSMASPELIWLQLFHKEGKEYIGSFLANLEENRGKCNRLD